MRLPTTGTITQGFYSGHQAVDIANKKGTAVVAPESGQVTFVGKMGSGTLDAGLVVQIGNPNSRGHRLCHLNRARVSVGQWVNEGQVVGDMGNTGYVLPRPTPSNPDAGTHLHWIMWNRGVRVDGRNHVTIVVPPKPAPSKMPPIGTRVRLLRGYTRTTFRAGTTTVAGTIRVTSDDFYYFVRGYDSKYPYRILINSASAGGSGVALALYYTNGSRIEGWVQA